MPIRMSGVHGMPDQALQCHPLWRRYILVNFYTGVGSCRTLQMKAHYRNGGLFCRSSRETVMVLKEGWSGGLYLENLFHQKATQSAHQSRGNQITVPSGFMPWGQTLTNLLTETCSRLSVRRDPDMRGWTIKGKPPVGPYCLKTRTALNRTPTAPAHQYSLGTKTASSFDYGDQNPRITPGAYP